MPPPATKADEVVSLCGGMYYAQEAPGMPPFVTEGMHFVKGQPLYIIEVMKMMNSVPAGVAGTVSEIVAENAQLVEYGAPLFRVQADA